MSDRRRCQRCQRDRLVGVEIARGGIPTCHDCAKAYHRVLTNENKRYRRAHRARPVRRCEDCTVEVPPKFRLCPDCALERRRAYGRRYAREHRDVMRRASRAYYRRVRNDPAAWAEHLGAHRMRHRLRAEREGRVIPPVPIEKYENPSYRWTVPAEALRAIVVEQEELIGREEVARLTGVTPRTLYRLVVEEAPTISVVAADKIAIALGLHLDLLYAEEAA